MLDCFNHQRFRLTIKREMKTKQIKLWIEQARMAIRMPATLSYMKIL